MRKTVAEVLLVAAMAPLPVIVPFAASLPASAPRMEGWERISGEAELENPRLRLQYEFFVDPALPGLYSLIRYRVTLAAGEHGFADYPATEKMQWHVTQKDLRRFECRPAVREADPCDWRELQQGSPEFHREMPVILWMYGVHRNLVIHRPPPAP